MKGFHLIIWLWYLISSAVVGSLFGLFCYWNPNEFLDPILEQNAIQLGVMFAIGWFLFDIIYELIFGRRDEKL